MWNGLNAIKRRWPAPNSRVGRLCLWFGCAFLILLALQPVFRPRGLVTALLVLIGIVLFPCLFILVLRWVNRRALWKVRNRLIVTYALMALAPLVLFGTLISIAAYITAGQYSINSALLALDEASDLLKGEISDVAGVLAIPNQKGDQHRLNFDQASNPRQPEMSVAVLENGVWKTVTLVADRGSTPPSPFANQGKAPWMQRGFHGVVVIEGKLYLCRYQIRTDDTRTVEVIGAFELNHAALNSMAVSLGRVLIYSGFTRLGSTDIDGAEKQAQTAEQEADAAQQGDTQEQARDAQQQVREAQNEAAEELRDAQEQASEGIRDATRDLQRAQIDQGRALHQATPSPSDQKESQERLENAQKLVQQAQKQAQEQLRAAAQKLSSAAPVLSVPKVPPVQSPRPPSPFELRLPARNHGNTEARHAPPVVQLAGRDQAQNVPAQEVPSQNAAFTAVSGGVLANPAHVLDPRVYFTAPLPIISLQDGGKSSAMLVVISRPSVLYTRLFSTSVEMGSFLRSALIAIAIFFGLVELVALWMATRLSGTITRSVAGL